MPIPDEPVDDDGFVPPLPPEDRLWRHPSELGAHGLPGAARPAVPPTARSGGRHRSRTVGTVLVSAAAGMVLTVGALAAMGVLEGQARTVVVEQVAVEPADDTAPVADTLGPAIARVDVDTPEGTRSATAVVYRSDGHLLTALDAVEGAEELAVTLADGRVMAAELVGVDAEAGVAVLDVDASALPTAVLGDADHASPGQTALAVSHGPAADAPPTVEAVRISGTGWRVDAGERSWHGVIRASVADPVDRGSVLCDEGGTVLGIVLEATDDHRRAAAASGGGSGPSGSPGSSGSTSSTRVAGTGEARFAMPIDYAVRVADELVAGGRARHAWFGADADDLDAATAATLGRTGARLTAVAPGGPAERGGLQEGDVVLSITTEPVGSASSLVVATRERRPGDVVSVRYARDGEVRVTMVTLDEKP